MNHFRQHIKTYKVSRDKVEIPCRGCDTTVTLKVGMADLKAWGAGGLIQDIFPDMSLTDRDTLVTGYCSECQKKIYDPNDEGI